MDVPADALLALFAELTGVMFCAKDADGHYTEVNDAFVRRSNQRTRAQVIGRRAGELFVAALAERYEEQDARVAEVAVACGFYDQPAFTRQFARLAGETPGGFRRRARPG